METLTQRRILIIEDEQIDRQIMQIFLSEEFDLSFAETFEAACNQLTQQSFDLVITDLNIGHQVEAAEILAFVRSSVLNQKVPVMAYSASRSGLYSGFDGHLTKPVRKEAFLKAVRSFLQ